MITMVSVEIVLFWVIFYSKYGRKGFCLGAYLTFLEKNLVTPVVLFLTTVDTFHFGLW